MNQEDCIFCKIIKGEIPSTTIYEDEDFKVILDRFPAAPGHVLILPKTHVENIYALDDEIGAKLFPLAKKIANHLQGTLDLDGLNILQNNGETAGQTVFHLHVHLIPRKKGDTVNVKWKALHPSDEEMEAMRAKLSL